VVAADRRVAVVLVSGESVEAAAAALLSLQGVPFGGGGGVLAVVAQRVGGVSAAVVAQDDGGADLEGREDGGQLAQEGHAEQDGEKGQKAAVLRRRDGESVDGGEKLEDSQADHEDGRHVEVDGPEVEGLEVVELEHDDAAEDDDGRGDDEEDRGQGQVLLVARGLPLHHG